MSFFSRPRGACAPAPVSAYRLVDSIELALHLGEVTPLTLVPDNRTWPGDLSLISAAVPAEEWPAWTDEVRIGLVDPEHEQLGEGGQA